MPIQSSLALSAPDLRWHKEYKRITRQSANIKAQRMLISVDYLFYTLLYIATEASYITI